MNPDEYVVAVVGVGMMGPGIAACAGLGGHPTILVGRSEKKGAAGVEKAGLCIDQLTESELIGASEAERAKMRITASADLAGSCAEASLIIEAIPEVLDIKQALFRDIERAARRDCILASTSSGMRISDIARHLVHADRAISAHFWLPGHLIPLVEVVMGDRTDPSVAEQLSALLEKWGKTPVIVRKELPGQLANRIQQAVVREAISMVQEGVASPEDIDTAIKVSFGMRFPAWGPLEHVDAVGLDLQLTVMRDVLPSLNNDSHAPEYLENLVKSGDLGFKTGRGFYDWSRKSMEDAAGTRDRFLLHALHFRQSMNSPRVDEKQR